MGYYVPFSWSELWVLWTKLSQQNKAKDGRLSIPLARKQKSMKVQILQKYESTSALTFLSWCIREFNFWGVIAQPLYNISNAKYNDSGQKRITLKRSKIKKRWLKYQRIYIPTVKRGGLGLGYAVLSFSCRDL